jgi:UDP-N-acetylmuramyl tripeptide synthase
MNSYRNRAAIPLTRYFRTAADRGAELQIIESSAAEQSLKPVRNVEVAETQADS